MLADCLLTSVFAICFRWFWPDSDTDLRPECISGVFRFWVWIDDFLSWLISISPFDPLLFVFSDSLLFSVICWLSRLTDRSLNWFDETEDGREGNLAGTLTLSNAKSSSFSIIVDGLLLPSLLSSSALANSRPLSSEWIVLIVFLDLAEPLLEA